jgi:cytoskeletal protein CcmA (bactofilin family)
VPQSKTQRANGGPLSIIASDVVIVGNIVAGGEIQLDGTIQGDVDCSALTLGESGVLTGSLKADRAVIRGQVRGSIDARTVTLERSATVVGDVSHQSVTIEAGAKVDGRFINTEAQLAKTDAPAPQIIPFKAAE